MAYLPDGNRYDGRMPYRRCGQSGLLLPAITLGCWHHFGGDGPTTNQQELIYRAFDGGITHFDLANNYGPPPGSAEVNVGRILKDLPRDEIIVSTKAGYLMWPGPYGEWGSRKYLLASLDQSLKRLGLEYVDLFYSHRFDPNTPLEETIGALETAVKQGKALYTGISSYTTAQTRQALDIAHQRGWTVPIIHQPNYSMLNRWIEKDLLPSAPSLHLGIIAFCPLFQGLLTNKYLTGNLPSNSRATTPGSLLRPAELSKTVIAQLRELNTIASQREQTLAQMALSWVLRNPAVTSALIGARDVQQLQENLSAVHKTQFSTEELSQIDSILARIELPPSLWDHE